MTKEEKLKIQKIVDLHTCLQGEGLYAGLPHFLIRNSGCNLNCQFSDWICDTSYASWAPEDGKYSLQDIQALIDSNPQIKYAFITGGNASFYPELLQQEVDLLKANNIFVAIEDNGTQYHPIKGLDFVTLSPKLANSTPKVGTQIQDPTIGGVVTQYHVDRHEKDRKNYISMKNWITNYDYQLKFVCTTEDQLVEIENLITLIKADKDKVCLMPEGVTAEQLAKRRAWLMELCIEKGYRYSDRLHIIAYDNKREA